MSGRVFTACIAAVASPATAFDLFEIIAPTESSIALLGWQVGQQSDEGASAHEMLRISLKRATGTYTSGSGGSTATPQSVVQGAGSVSSGGSVEVMNTTQAAAGTGALVTLLSDAFDVFAGHQIILPPEFQFTAKATDALILSVDEAPADALTINGTAWFREV